ncbi:MAG: L-lactate dehydrogenase [Clostridia bacterium]|jgi:L-lactate dehydrogenase|nr:L-lactate dehydrogenase [Clostridia bacterium]
MSDKSRKVVILGAGHVGSHVGMSLMCQGIADKIIYIDTDEAKAYAQALDLNDATGSVGKRVEIRTGDYSDCTDADVVVCAIGSEPVPGKKRLDMFDETLQMAKTIVGPLKESGFNGILVSISNPADIIADFIRKRVGLPKNKVFSTGTALDSNRLRRVLYEKTGIDRNSIQAFCMGEHGDSSMVAFSRVYMGGRSLMELMKENPDTLGKIDFDEIIEEVHTSGFKIVSGKHSTEFGIGLVCCEIIKAVFCDQKKIMAVSPLLDGEYDQHGVHAGVPCVIGKDGIEKIIEMPLLPNEKAAFNHSCDVIRGYIKKADNM